MIGLATNTTLNFEEEGYGWVDEGLVIESTGAEDYNCKSPCQDIGTIETASEYEEFRSRLKINP